jgi:hypothetical protein
MKRIITKTTDSAVVGIVTAILIIGLAITVIAIVQTVYIPKIMEQREAEHMEVVAEQFASLTSVIDGQAADGRKSIPIASFITLGNKELPFLVSSKAFGTLEILENSCTITVTNKSQTSIFPIGAIAYSSANAYYLDQSYTYEVGAMIVSQTQGNMMMIRPGFFVDYNESNDPPLTITFDVVNISCVGNKTIASGFGTYPIQTEFHKISRNITFYNVSSINISSPFSNAWFIFVNNSLIRAGLNSEGLGYDQFTLTKTAQAVQLDFPCLYSDPNDCLAINIIFKIIEIQAQIGPGWVE